MLSFVYVFLPTAVNQLAQRVLVQVLVQLNLGMMNLFVMNSWI